MKKKVLLAGTMAFFLAALLYSVSARGALYSVSQVSTEEPFNLWLNASSMVINETARTATIDGRFFVPSNGTVPAGNKYLGFSFGELLSAGSVSYRNTGTTGAYTVLGPANFTHLSAYSGYQHVYYATFPAVPAGTDKEFRLAFTFTARPEFFIVYFGTGSTILKVEAFTPSYTYINSSSGDVRALQYTPYLGRFKQFWGKSGTSWVLGEDSATAYGFYGTGLGQGTAAEASDNFTTDKVWFSTASASNEIFNWTIADGHPLVVGMVKGDDNADAEFIFRAAINNALSGTNYISCAAFEDETFAEAAYRDLNCPNGAIYHDAAASTSGLMFLYDSTTYTGSGGTANFSGINIVRSGGSVYDRIAFANNDGHGVRYFNAAISDMCFMEYADGSTNQTATLKAAINEFITAPDLTISGNGEDRVITNDCHLTIINDSDNSGNVSFSLTPSAGSRYTLAAMVNANLTNAQITWDGMTCVYPWNGTGYENTACPFDKNVSITRFSNLKRSGRAIVNLTTVIFPMYNFSTSASRSVTITEYYTLPPQPGIVIFSPGNATYSELNVTLAVSANKTITTWWYNLNGNASIFTPNTTITAAAGPNYLTVNATDTDGLFASASVAFTVVLPVPPAVYDAQRSYCLSERYFYQRVAVPADDGSLTMNDRLTYCDYGCANFTLAGLGAPGCVESPLTLYLLLIAAAVLVTVTILWLARRNT